MSKRSIDELAPAEPSALPTTPSPKRKRPKPTPQDPPGEQSDGATLDEATEPNPSPMRKRSKASSNDAPSSIPKANENRRELDDEMRGTWVGPMPVHEFLENFMPAAETPRPFHSRAEWKALWSAVPIGRKPEWKMYQSIIDAIEKSGLSPHLKLVNTSNKHDRLSEEGHRIRPDLTWYRRNLLASLGDSLQWGHSSGYVEVKPSYHGDPVDDLCDPAPREPEAGQHGESTGPQPHRPESTPSNRTKPFTPQTDISISERGQMIAYNTELCDYQHRNFAFSLLFMGTFIRLFRWDRAGVIVSQIFDYQDDPNFLGEYLWRFNHMTDSQLGLDGTVRNADNKEKLLAKTHLGPHIFDRSCPIFHIDGPESKCFLVWEPIMRPLSPLGRATRAYVAFEIATGKVVFLKDVWRVDHQQWPTEGFILDRLNAKGVRNIPKVETHGDVDPGSLGVTQSDKFARKAWCLGDVAGIIPRKHYRLVTAFAGVRLRHFRTGKELLTAVYHAMIAHEDALKHCQILHRDINANNILIRWDEKNEARGTLVDWEFARTPEELRVARLDHTSRFPRSGNWQFLSVLVLNFGKAHGPKGDFESFVHVVMHLGMRYLRHNCETNILTVFKNLYDSTLEEEGKTVGGTGKQDMFLFNRHIGEGFKFNLPGARPHPLTKFVDIAFDIVKTWLVPVLFPHVAEVPSKAPTSALTEAIASLLSNEDWPQDDKVSDQLKAARERTRPVPPRHVTPARARFSSGGDCDETRDDGYASYGTRELENSVRHGSGQGASGSSKQMFSQLDSVKEADEYSAGSDSEDSEA